MAIDNIIRGDAAQTAEPWFPGSFDGSGPARARGVVAAKEAVPPPTAPLESAPEVDEVAIARQQGFEQGFAEGRAAGYAEGHAEGRDAGHTEGFAAGQQDGLAAMQQAASELAALLKPCEEAVVAAEHQLSQELVELALEIARQMVRQAIAFRPDVVAEIVKDAVGSLPHLHDPPRIYLHPADAALVAEALAADIADGGWQILDDATLDRGGVRIITGRSELDVTLPERWRRLVQALGRNDEWLGGLPLPEQRMQDL